jgi:hypothetical protein
LICDIKEGTRLEVLTVVSVKIVCWDMVACSQVEQENGTYLAVYTSHPRIQRSSYVEGVQEEGAEENILM